MQGVLSEYWIFPIFFSENLGKRKGGIPRWWLPQPLVPWRYRETLASCALLRTTRMDRPMPAKSAWPRPRTTTEMQAGSAAPAAAARYRRARASMRGRLRRGRTTSPRKKACFAHSVRASRWRALLRRMVSCPSRWRGGWRLVAITRAFGSSLGSALQAEDDTDIETIG